MSSPLSTTPTSSNFEVIFNAAVAQYTNQTGNDLYSHPLASKVGACDSIESVLAIFQEQAQAFDKFRSGNHKLIQWLQPVVSGLYTLSTCPALSTGVSLVSPRNHIFSRPFPMLLSCRRFTQRQQFYPESASFYLWVSPALSPIAPLISRVTRWPSP